MKPKIKMLAKSLTSEDIQNINQASFKVPALKAYSFETLQILYLRGIKEPNEMLQFLECDYKDMEDAFKLKDSDKFVKMVTETIFKNEDITFYTDYDMDGIGSAYTGVKGLRNYAKIKNSTSQINWYANSRFIEGYGITPNGVEDLLNKFPSTKMIITTDNGIVGFEGVQKAKDLGIKIIVTDHHEPAKDGTMVNADAIIDPKRLDDETKTPLCGAGVIFKLLMCLYYENVEDWEQVLNYIDIVSLSTVADMVPLIGDNRIIVKWGLDMAQKETTPCFRILREVYNEITIKDSAKILDIDEETFGFTYGPAFNSLGRLYGIIDDAMNFLLGDNEEEQRELAKKIFETNKIRKTMTEEANNVIDVELSMKYPTENELPPIIVIENDIISEGIIGLIATHVKDKYHRPTIVFTKISKTIKDENENDMIVESYKGSARSLGSFDISLAFEYVKNAGYILGFGGHTMAAGLSIAIDKLDDFTSCICDYGNKILTPDDLIPTIEVDFAKSVSEITLDLVDALREAAPYGMGFKKPLIGITNFTLDKRQYKIQEWNSVFVGENKQTTMLKDTNGLNALMFKSRYRFEDILSRIPNAENYNQIYLKLIGVPRKSYYSFRNCWVADFLIDGDYLFDQNFN